MDPAEAKEIMKETRAAPEPLDGELGTGPTWMVRQDIERISVLMQMGVFSKREKDNMLRLMGSIVANDGVPASVRIRAYSTIQAEIKLYSQLLGLLPEQEDKKADEIHLHLHGNENMSPAAAMIEDMKKRMNAGSEFRQLDKPAEE